MMHRSIRSISSRHIIGLGIALLSATILAGCGGGGGTTCTSNCTPPPQTDMGTLTSMGDTNTYTFKNAASSMVLGISGQLQTAGTNVVQESSSTATNDIYWHFMPMNNNEDNVENMLTHQVLGILNGSTSTGAQALQYSDNATNDHLWEFYVLTDGNYLIKNVNSGYYLQDEGSGTTTSATIDQGARSSSVAGCTCQEWAITSSGNAAYPAPLTVSGAGIYVHDPMLIQDPTTFAYWLYGTHNTLAHSTDLSTWTADNPALDPIPSWVTTYNSTDDLWAPDVVYANGYYWQYYAASGSGSEVSAIGLAKATTPSSTAWTDEGIVIASTTTSGYNAIDPNPTQDASGDWWMTFGSWFDGIYLMQLDNTTMKQSTTNTTLYHLAERNNGIEGSFIYYYNGYYYLFTAINGCCAGTSSTYRTVVGRSSTINGTYTDRGGVNMLDGGGTIVVSSHSNIYGPGGASLFTDTGSSGAESLPTIVYHYYDGNNNGTPTLGINRLAFTSDGWPYIQ
ncbi:MAG: family 43 glycosylhydrolase [Terracidiphilus sp.]